MLLLFLLVLSVASIHSLPCQENCTEIELEFHKCLRQHYPQIILSTDTKGYQSQRSIFSQCGAEHSNCHLQTSLMTIIEALIHESKKDKTDNFDKAIACYESLANETKKECMKRTFNNRGFRLPLYESSVEFANCVIEKSNSIYCVSKNIVEFVELADALKIRAYRMKYSRFLLFVKMNAKKDEKIPLVLPGKFIQPPHCKKSEKQFKDCVKEKKFLPSDYKTRKDVFRQCGAEESDCYLQKHLMKMVNTINNTYVGFTDFFTQHDDCPEVIDSIRLECMRPGFDGHGFPKPDGEFEYHEARCKAEQWRRSRRCTKFNKRFQAELALEKYNIAIKDFAISLGLVEDDI